MKRNSTVNEAAMTEEFVLDTKGEKEHLLDINKLFLLTVRCVCAPSSFLELED